MTVSDIIDSTIQLAGIHEESTVDGPGIRYTVFTQGCLHNCPGCHNKDTHTLNGGYREEINKITEDIKKAELITGVTVSGGEPFLQLYPLRDLLRKIKKETQLNTMLYTGYTLEELRKPDGDFKDRAEVIEDILNFTDILVDGRFIESQKSMALKFRGSKNQRLIPLNRTGEELLNGIQ